MIPRIQFISPGTDRTRTQAVPASLHRYLAESK